MTREGEDAVEPKVGAFPGIFCLGSSAALAVGCYLAAGTGSGGWVLAGVFGVGAIALAVVGVLYLARLARGLPPAG
jgi:hypothetical protein